MSVNYKQAEFANVSVVVPEVEPRWRREAWIEKALICAVLLAGFGNAIWAIASAQ